MKEYIISVLLAIILPVKLYLLIAGIIYHVDIYLGTRKAIRNKTFDWQRFLSGYIYKLMIYSGGIILLYWFQELLLFEVISFFFSIPPNFIIKFGTMLIVSTEMISIHKKIKERYGFDVVERYKNVIRTIKTIKKDLND